MSRLRVCDTDPENRNPDTHTPDRQMVTNGDIQKRIFLDVILFLRRSTGFPYWIELNRQHTDRYSSRNSEYNAIEWDLNH